MEDIVGKIIGIYDVQYLCDFKATDGHKLYHVKCVFCGFETNMTKTHIGRATICNHKKNIVIHQCKQCGHNIPISASDDYNSYEIKKFCSHSCSAKYNNHNRKERKHKQSYCLNCGKPCRNKYCNNHNKCKNEYEQRQWVEKWISGEISGTYETNNWGDVPCRIRTYLFEKYDSKCSKCGWGEINPYTGKIPLEVEHIDGNYQNNRPENVTLLCPNCHSLTATYRGANRGKGRPKTWAPTN